MKRQIDTMELATLLIAHVGQMAPGEIAAALALANLAGGAGEVRATAGQLAAAAGTSRPTILAGLAALTRRGWIGTAGRCRYVLHFDYTHPAGGGSVKNFDSISQNSLPNGQPAGGGSVKIFDSISQKSLLGASASVKNFDSTSQNSLPNGPPTYARARALLTTTAINSYSENEVVAVTRALREAGVAVNGSMARILAMGHPLAYIEAHIDKWRRGGGEVGLLITRLLDGDPMPQPARPRVAVPPEYADLVKR